MKPVDGRPPLELVPPALTVCSLCLRVERDGSWSEAETVIRETRSFDLGSVLKLEPGLCDRCATDLRARRHARPVAA
jgi:hypothetical protein